MLPPRDQFQIETCTWTKSKGMEKDILCRWKRKKPGVAVLTSTKIDYKTKATVRDREGHYITIKGTTRGYKLSKHLPSQHKSAYICKANLDGHKGRD